MDEIHLLRGHEGKTTAIYTQNRGESPAYTELSQVCRSRLVAMYNIYLDYLLKELSAIDPEARNFVNTLADHPWQDSRKTTAPG